MIDLGPGPALNGPGGADPAGEEIDLGEGGWDPDEAALSWRAPVWLTVTAKVAALALMALGTLAAATGTVIKELGEPLWTARVAWDSFQLGRDVVYLRDGSTEMAARDSQTGQELWRRDLGGDPMSTVELGPGVTVMFSQMQPDREDGDYEVRALFVEPRSGAVLAEKANYASAFRLEPMGGSAEQALLLGFQQGATEQCPLGECYRLTAIDLGTLDEVWDVVAPPQSGVVLSWVDDVPYGPLNGFAVVGPEGRVTTYDGTGPTPIASFTVDVASAGGSMSAEALILSTERPGPDVAVMPEQVLTAYSRTTGAQLWQTVSPLGRRPESSMWPHPHDCAGYLCFVTGAGTAVLDARTGQVLAVADDQGVLDIGDGLLLTTGGPERSEPDHDLTVRDLDTGRVLADLPETSFVSSVGAGARRVAVQSQGEESRVILIEESGRARVLGTIPGLPVTCTARGDLLACTHGTGQMAVWQLPIA